MKYRTQKFLFYYDNQSNNRCGNIPLVSYYILITMQWYTGYGNRTMGKWAILINHERLYWFYGDGGSADGYGERHYMRLDYLGYISTWSRDYHVYHDKWDQVGPTSSCVSVIELIDVGPPLSHHAERKQLGVLRR